MSPSEPRAAVPAYEAPPVSATPATTAPPDEGTPVAETPPARVSLDDLKKALDASLEHVQQLEQRTRETVARLESRLGPLQKQFAALEPLANLADRNLQRLQQAAADEARAVAAQLAERCAVMEYESRLRQEWLAAAERRWAREGQLIVGPVEAWSERYREEGAASQSEFQELAVQLVSLERRWLTDPASASAPAAGDST